MCGVRGPIKFYGWLAFYYHLTAAHTYLPTPIVQHRVVHIIMIMNKIDHLRMNYEPLETTERTIGEFTFLSLVCSQKYMLKSGR